MRILLILLFISYNSYSQTIIELEKLDGVYQIPSIVNGLNLKFIFDTGASDVSISISEAEFMFKYGYLKEEDIIGVENYQLADGGIIEGLVINLKTIKIGDVVFENIQASIIDSENAPLLLGQSLIKELGNYRFDYENNLLIFNEEKGRKKMSQDENYVGGFIYYYLEDYDSAIILLNKSIELNPYADSYNKRGSSKQKLGDLDGACSDWRKAANLGDIKAKELIAENCNSEEKTANILKVKTNNYSLLNITKTNYEIIQTC